MLQKYRALQFIYVEIVDLQNVYIIHGKNGILTEVFGAKNYGVKIKIHFID